ncbi:MAG: ABC transporter ATP-binding protein [Planctomycetota bacterium]|jgi:ABC-2 type transport system ATP-binding protein
MGGAVIETRDLTRHYGATVGLEGLDLSVEAGEVLGFLGPNGAGKTTCIRLLLDLIRPTRGSARLFGRPVSDASARANVGYLPGELALDERMTGRAMLDLLDALRPAGNPPCDPRRQAELCERLRLSDADLRRVVRDDSRGTKQKIGLVAALQRDPELLVLDEPTTGLDPLVRDELLALLGEAGAGGRTVFYSSHILSDVDRTCSRVAILREGRLVTLQDMDALRGSLTRTMIVRFRGAVPAAELDVPGARLVREQDGLAEIRVTGALGPLLAVLARHPVGHMAFPEPDLEDAFRRYYSADDGS